MVRDALQRATLLTMRPGEFLTSEIVVLARLGIAIRSAGIAATLKAGAGLGYFYRIESDITLQWIAATARCKFSGRPPH